jgi:hypothetical protein
MDAGVSLATIQRWLGHHNISQTSKYLAASLVGDADVMRKFERRIGRLTASVTVESALPVPAPGTDSVHGNTIH